MNCFLLLITLVSVTFSAHASPRPNGYGVKKVQMAANAGEVQRQLDDSGLAVEGLDGSSLLEIADRGILARSTLDLFLGFPYSDAKPQVKELVESILATSLVANRNLVGQSRLRVNSDFDDAQKVLTKITELAIGKMNDRSSTAKISPRKLAACSGALSRVLNGTPKSLVAVEISEILNRGLEPDQYVVKKGEDPFDAIVGCR